MKNKRNTIIKGGLIAAMLAVSAGSFAACLVDINPGQNEGHCRLSGDDIYICYRTGEGPACKDTVIIFE